MKGKQRPGSEWTELENGGADPQSATTSPSDANPADALGKDNLCGGYVASMVV